MWLGAKECDSFQNRRGQARVESSHPGKGEQADPRHGRFHVFRYSLCGWSAVCVHTAHLRLWGDPAGPESSFGSRSQLSVARRVSELGFLALYRTTDQCSLGFAIPRCLRFGSI